MALTWTVAARTYVTTGKSARRSIDARRCLAGGRTLLSRSRRAGGRGADARFELDVHAVRRLGRDAGAGGVVGVDGAEAEQLHERADDQRDFELPEVFARAEA